MKDVNVLCYNESEDRIAEYTASLSLGLEINVLGLSTLESDCGTADLFALLHMKIKVEPPCSFAVLIVERLHCTFM